MFLGGLTYSWRNNQVELMLISTAHLREENRRKRYLPVWMFIESVALNCYTSFDHSRLWQFVQWTLLYSLSPLFLLLASSW